MQRLPQWSHDHCSRPFSVVLVACFSGASKEMALAPAVYLVIWYGVLVIPPAVIPLRRAHEPVVPDGGWRRRQCVHARPTLMPRAEHLVQDCRLDLGERVGGVVARAWEVDPQIEGNLPRREDD